MKTTHRTALTLVFAALTAAAIHAADVGTAFTYQGQLLQSDAPANGPFAMEFRIFDGPVSPPAVQVGPTVPLPAVAVENGLFSVELDFLSGVFTGQERWLEVKVGATTLAPRQRITPAPYALALPGLFTQQNGNTPNVIGGASLNTIAPNVVGAIIAGGGDLVCCGQNLIFDNKGVIGGGTANKAGTDNDNPLDAPHATIGGGVLNVARGVAATIAGGQENLASGAWSTVPGGFSNDAGANYSFAAGRRAGAYHLGSFVWSDSTTIEPSSFSSTAANQFLIKATGGVGINKNDPQAGALDVNGPAIVTGFKMPTGAADNRVLTSDALGNGTWQTISVGSGDITGVTAGTGLAGGGLSGDVTLSASFAGNGAASTVARSDHYHSTLAASDGSPSTAVTLDAAGNVGIGTPPTNRLTVGGVIETTSGGVMFPDGQIQATASPWQATGTHISTTNADYVGIGIAIPAYELHIARATELNADLGIECTNPAADTRSRLFLKTVNHSWSVENDGFTNDIFKIYDQTALTARFAIDTNGDVGIGTTDPNTRLHVVGGSDSSLAAGGYVVAGSVTGSNMVLDDNEIMARSNGAAATLYLNHDGGDVLINGAGTGNVGVGTTSPLGRLDARATTTDGIQGHTSAAGKSGVAGFTSNAASYGGYFDNTAGGVALWCNGTARVSVLEITGADVAEKFPVSDRVEPGMVVEIDPDHAGQLRLSCEAYNRRVAGVVSGAGGLSVGAVLGNLPGHEDAPPIALSGRVWVHCDASSGPIQPGDLLTTSGTPGHAMKVADFAAAQGATIGKAMTPLAEGEQGLVLVLVSLQ